MNHPQSHLPDEIQTSPEQSKRHNNKAGRKEKMASQKVISERPPRSTAMISSALMSSAVSSWLLRSALFLSLLLNLCLLMFSSSSKSAFESQRGTFNGTSDYQPAKINELDRILLETATPNKTILLTYLNEAWIAPNSMFDLFLESFRSGHNTRWLLRHLLVVSLDERAHLRCLDVHPHCYYYKTDQFNLTQEATYMSSNYLEIVWRKIDFMHAVLNKGYSFIFSDGDVIWFRNPFPHLKNDSNFQVSCDNFNGRPRSLSNLPNTGFMYVSSDKHTTLFFKIWYSLRFNYKNMKNQEVFNIMKKSGLFKLIGLDVKFLAPIYFSGFCRQSRNFSQVINMHANCCIGLAPKVHDLSLILKDWKKYALNKTVVKDDRSWRWSAPRKCRNQKFS